MHGKIMIFSDFRCEILSNVAAEVGSNTPSYGIERENDYASMKKTYRTATVSVQ
jgi:hypothetical protein